MIGIVSKLNSFSWHLAQNPHIYTKTDILCSKGTQWWNTCITVLGLCKDI